MTIGMSIWEVSLIGFIISHSQVRRSSDLDDGLFIDELQGLLRQDAGFEVFDRVLAPVPQHLHHLRHVHLQRARHLPALVFEVPSLTAMPPFCAIASRSKPSLTRCWAVGRLSSRNFWTLNFSSS